MVSNWRLACHINLSPGRCPVELAQGPSRVGLVRDFVFLDVLGSIIGEVLGLCLEEIRGPFLESLSCGCNEKLDYILKNPWNIN